MKKSDALAVIDLADTCRIFEEDNYIVAGICYNNIASIQFRMRNYKLACQNY